MIDIVHDTVDLEVRDHFVDVVGHDQRVGFARRLVDIAALPSDRIVLQVVPAPLQDKTVHGIGVALPRQNAGLGHLQQVHPVTLRDVQAERAEMDVLGLPDPEAIVVGRDRVGNHDLGQRVGRHRQPVRNARILIDLDDRHRLILSVHIAA